jgi:small GTP-binding protein
MFNSSSDDDTVVDYDEEIKVVVLGESGVGKSNIINRYNGGQFDPNSVPNNSSFFMSKNLKFGEKIYRINLWDTAGQEKYHSLTKIFLNEAKIAFIIYAINDKASYEKIDFWYNLVKESCGNIVIAIIGNKKDLYEEEQVNEEDAIKKAKSLNATFGLTSALEDDTGFDEIINKVLKKYIEDQGESTENQVFSSNIKLSLRDTIKSTKSEDSSKKKKKLC